MVDSCVRRNAIKQIIEQGSVQFAPYFSLIHEKYKMLWRGRMKGPLRGNTAVSETARRFARRTA